MSEPNSPASPASPGKRAIPWVAIVGSLIVGGGLLAAIWFVFMEAPREREMGQVQRIFYFHVASAFAALIGYIVCAVASLAFLVLGAMRGQQTLARMTDRLAYAAGEIGVLFGVIVLVTGPLWAKPAWGEAWTWEPRLVLTLLTEFLFIGYIILRYQMRDSATGSKFAAGVAVVGGPAVYLIHMAVELWGGNHPQVVTGDGGGLAPGMKGAFALAVISTLVFAAYLIVIRMRHHRLASQVDEAWLDLSDLEGRKP